jgi:hypothetical protein
MYLPENQLIGRLKFNRGRKMKALPMPPGGLLGGGYGSMSQ